VGRKVCSSSACNSGGLALSATSKMSKCLPSAEASVRRTSRFRICISADGNLKCCFETTTVPSDNQTSTNQQPWPRKYCLQFRCRAEQHSTRCMSRLASASERTTYDIGDLCVRARDIRHGEPRSDSCGGKWSLGIWLWVCIACGRRFQKMEDVNAAPNQCERRLTRLPSQRDHVPTLQEYYLHRHISRQLSGRACEMHWIHLQKSPTPRAHHTSLATTAPQASHTPLECSQPASGPSPSHASTY
jgi:hypothetical protein